MEWNEFLKEWDKRQEDIRLKALEIKEIPGPKIAAANKRIENLKLQVDEMVPEVEAYEREVDRYQRQLDRLQAKLKNLIEPFEKELLEGYKEYIQLEIPMGAADGFYLVPEQADQILEAGTYTIFIRATNDGEEFWAMKDIDLVDHQAKSYEIGSYDFVSALSYILEDEETDQETGEEEFLDA